MRFEARFAVGAAFLLVGCSESASTTTPDNRGVCNDAPSFADASVDASKTLVEGGHPRGVDASGGAPSLGLPADAAPDAGNKDAGATPIPIDGSSDFSCSPVPLSKLMGTGSESRAELVSKLRDNVLATDELFHPYAYDGTDWAQAAEDLVADGWQANQEPPLPMVPPIDWGNGHDDPNWHFQLNSLRPAVPFAYASWRTNDTANLERMLAIVNDWVDYNLIDNRSNAMKWYDMGSGLRAHYIGVTLTELLRRGPDASDAGAERAFDRLVEKLVWVLHEHGTRLADPSFLPAGNHALFVTLGLVTVCRVIPQFAECANWPSYALEAARNYVSGSVSSENVSLEHSPSYHRFVALTLRDLDATTLYDANMKVVADGMLENLVWMYHPDREISLVGDSEGQAASGESAQLDYMLSEGSAGVEPPNAPIGFFQAGFAILRDDWSRRPMSGHSYLFFSAAHHSKVHKQADDFTFEWSRRGVPIILDSGKFEYKDSAVRSFFMSTRSANTIEVDGQNIQIGGVAAYGSALTDVGKTASGVQYAAAIVVRRPTDVEHARVLAMHDDWLLVADRVTSATTHTYRQWFGLHENFDLVDSTSTALGFSDGGGNDVRMIPLADHQGFESARGETDPEMQGWISHVYQTRVPRWSVASRVSASNATIVSLFATPAVSTASAVLVGDTVEVTVESGGAAKRYTVAFGRSTGSVSD